jgi:hypothetical protein
MVQVPDNSGMRMRIRVPVPHRGRGEGRDKEGSETRPLGISRRFLATRVMRRFNF